MFKPTEVKALPGYRLFLRYDNGAEGEVDLSDLAGRGVFALWNDYDSFEQVQIEDGGALVWNDQVDLCPDMLYMRLTGKSPEELFPNLAESSVDA